MNSGAGKRSARSGSASIAAARCRHSRANAGAHGAGPGRPDDPCVPSCSTTRSPTITSPRSAWRFSTCFAPPAFVQDWRGTSAVGVRRSRKACSGSADACRTECRGAASACGRGAEDRVLRAELSFRRCARTRRRCFVERRGRRQRPLRRRACCSRNMSRPPPRIWRSSQAPLKFCCTATVIRSRWDLLAPAPKRCSRTFQDRPSSISTPAAAAWRARSAMPPRTSTCRARSASGSCCRPSATRRREPSWSPPARRAVIR